MGSGTIRQYSGFFSIGQRLFDVAVICGSRMIVWLLYEQPWTDKDTIVAGVAVLSFLLAAEVNGVYRSWRGTPLRDELRVVLWSWLMAVPWVLLWLFATKTSENFSRLATLGWFVATAIVLSAARSLKNSALGSLRIQGRNMRNAGIIGATAIAQRLRKELTDPVHGIRVLGVYDSRNEQRVQEHIGEEPLIGDLNQALEDARLGKLDLIYIALPLRAEARIAETVAALADSTATVQLVTDFSAFDLLRARWASVGNLPMVSLFDTPFSGASGVIKRIEDLCLGWCFLILASPVMLMIALAVKLTTRGPVFFTQHRYGLNGKPIRVLKFRSMKVADDGARIEQATKDDRRFTPIGKFLRSSSLDELPQLFNVIKGDMSLVGPRPHAVAHNEAYRGLIHGYMLRHKVKPGITGWAQVNGLRGETDTIEKMRARIQYDLEYIENWDLRWDLEIIMRTVFRVWADKNAY
jgi:putative colanic acid biosysnthesis UDP-glucose lipid carrier transferase